MKNIFISLLFTTLTWSIAFSQDSIITKSNWSIGAFGNYHVMQHTTQLPVFFGSADCGVFTEGQNNGYSAGLSLEYSLLPSFLSLSGRIGYSSRPGTLSTSIANFEVFEPQSRTYQPLVQKHTFDAILDYLVFDVGIIVQPLEEIPLRLRLAADAGNPIFANSFLQTEEITSPNTVLFPDERKIRTNDQGIIQTATTSYNANALLSYDFPVSAISALSLEIGYRYGLADILSDATWKQQSYFGGIAFRTRIGDDKYLPPPPIPAPKIDTIIPPPPAVRIENKEPAIRFAALSSQPIIVEETIVTQTFPLLPYIFFDSANAVLPTKMMQKKKVGFNEADLPKDMLQTYYHLLDIIGKRLLESPKSVITIVGNSDGIEMSSQKERLAIAKQRAATVSDYLKNEWKIRASQITTEIRDTPKIPTNIRYTEGYEENRRVEIYTDDPQILRPVVHSRFLEFTGIQRIQGFNAVTRKDIQPRSWKIVLRGKQGEIVAKNGTLAPQTQSLELPSSIIADIKNHVFTGDSLKAQLSLTFDDGSELNSECSLPVFTSKNVFEVSRLSLIVFDFNRFDISNQNKRMMQQFVKDAIKSTSQTTITGTTDRLGEADYNIELSKSRALSVRDYLLSIQPTLQLKEVKGIGASILPFDNNVPEGRYYCRTVSIEVKTPVR
ncbi:MAG: OmpA family protein [Candidatus Kapabacteria bacterium]|nr:OmpA family protein [Candidatus Kapabacteria bacterium]